MWQCLIYGGSSLKQREYALLVASQQNWNFVQVEPENFESELYKSSITTSLSGINLFYLSGVESLKEPDLKKLLSFSQESSHRFIFSTRAFYKLPKEFRDKCHQIKIGEVQPEKFFVALQTLMTEPNREKVRRVLSDPEIDIEPMLHILKDNVWKSENPQVFEAVEKCLRYLYKVDNDYLVSLLAYLFPSTKLVISYENGNRKVYKCHFSILSQLKKKYRLSNFEALQLLDVMKQTPELFKNLNLSESERKYLGVEEREISEAIRDTLANESASQTGSNGTDTRDSSTLSRWM